MEGDVNRLCLHCMQFALDEEGVCTSCGTDAHAGPASPHHLAPRTVLGGKYLTARVLGEGGFGITYLGWDINLEVKVAIKEFFPLGAVTRNTTVSDTVTSLAGNTESLFTQGRERFIDEARRLAKFYDQPGIVSVKDFFLENGTAYIVMEFVEGVTLKDFLESSGGRMKEEVVLELMKPLVRSLAEVHRAGIIHRDISPDNIMLTPGGQLRLIDFGAARDFGDENKSLSVLLKPGYAPEEQYRSKGRQGPWTDVHAFSATMYRAIEGDKPQEALERALEDAATSFSAPVSRKTNDALMKGLAVRQENRWQNLDELYEALYGGPPPAAAAAPVAAAPSQPPDKEPKKKLNVKVLAMVVAAILVVVIAIPVILFSGGEGSVPDSGSTPSSMAAPGSQADAGAGQAAAPPLTGDPIRIGMQVGALSDAPMSHREEDGTLVGFDIDLAHAIGAEMGAPVEIVELSPEWQTVLVAMAAGEIDFAMGGISVTPEKSAQMLFSEPYIRFASVILTYEPSEADIAGATTQMRLGILRSMYDYWEMQGNEWFLSAKENLVPFDTVDELLAVVPGPNLNSQVDGIVIDRGTALNYNEENGDLYTVIEIDAYQLDYAIAFAPGDETYVEQVNAILEQMKEDETLFRLSWKWTEADLILY